MGFFPILFLIFLTLKLLGVIAWSWWLVFTPLYPAIIVWAFLILYVILA